MACFEKLILVAATALALSACGTAIPLNDAPVIDKRADHDNGPIPMCCVNPDGPEHDALNDPAGILAKRSVYFDHDGYIVKEKFRPMLEAHAQYLRSRKARTLSVVGHTDEHGSREYNLALGQKRAEAVQRILVLLGLPASQMESISYGEEKPKASGNDEAAWAENRRVDLEYR